MTNTLPTQSFAVTDVALGGKPMADLPYYRAVSDFIGGPVESCSRYHGKLAANVRSHPLIGALHAAYCYHFPVTLSPDIIWQTICQGFANHVNMNAEKLRPLVVKHPGKLKITVRRDEFIKGSPENEWPGVFGEFSEAIRAHVGEIQDVITAGFSTTGPVERAASEVALLDAMQAFFSYELETLCGIPSVTLEGTVDDWRNIGDRVRKLAAYDFDWWTDELQPVLQEFAAAADGRANRRFWNSIYKWEGPKGSGSPHVSGWILKLFPYVENPRARYVRSHSQPEPELRRNPWLSRTVDRHGPGRAAFPSLPARAPFVWNYLGNEYSMELVGGLIGVAQDPTTLSLRPEIGWAVRSASAERVPAELVDEFRAL